MILTIKLGKLNLFRFCDAVTCIYVHCKYTRKVWSTDANPDVPIPYYAPNHIRLTIPSVNMHIPDSSNDSYHKNWSVLIQQS